MVSICMITYNHEKYISHAIESLLMQKTNFYFEIIISDDASKDNNQNIIKQYQMKNHNKIKSILRDVNIGMQGNFISAINNCKGRYIAFCEGDDYWTDPNKLQKQVDFLEGNPEYAAVGHQTKIIFENDPSRTEIFPENPKEILLKKDMIFSWQIHTSSIVFRRNALMKYDLSGVRYFVEHAVFILIAQSGKFRVFPEVMSVYRRHDHGAAGTSTPEAAYPGQIGWIKEVRNILGRRFFWGYHFLSSKVHTYYAINFPEFFRKSIFKTYLYFFKYGFLTLLFYPRNIRTILRMIPQLVKKKPTL